MKVLSKFFFVASILSLSALAHAEGVSIDDIEAGNHPYTESSVETSSAEKSED